MFEKVDLTRIRKEAEDFYRNGDYFCSEAIVAAIRNGIEPAMPIESIAMASGFPVGIGGAQCVCGAVSGGVICLGYFFGRTSPADKKIKKAMTLAKEIHDYFSLRNKVTCCRVLTKGMRLGSSNHMKQCISFTGDIAEKTAEIICRELRLSAER